MHRLAQADGPTRQHESPPLSGELGDAGQRGIASGAVDQRGAQHGSTCAAHMRD